MFAPKDDEAFYSLKARLADYELFSALKAKDDEALKKAALKGKKADSPKRIKFTEAEKKKLALMSAKKTAELDMRKSATRTRL